MKICNLITSTTALFQNPQIEIALTSLTFKMKSKGVTLLLVYICLDIMYYIAYTLESKRLIISSNYIDSSP